MISREFKVDLKLKNYINSYWYYSICTDTEKHFDIFPDGHFDLVVTIKENKIVDTILTGIWTKTASISYTEDTAVFGISFNPLASGKFLQFNIKELLDDYRKVSLADFNINEQYFIKNLSEPEVLVAYLNKQLIEHIPEIDPDTRLKMCFELIDSSNGNIPVKEISKIVGLSPRHLHKLVSKMLGIGIKEYSKIIRLKKSLFEIKNDKSNYSHYYDQSHFIRELKLYTGLTPQKMDLKNNDRFIQYYYFE